MVLYNLYGVVLVAVVVAVGAVLVAVVVLVAAGTTLTTRDTLPVFPAASVAL